MRHKTIKLLISALALIGVMTPLVATSPASGQVETEAARARWRTIHYQTFEGVWPVGLWQVRDRNNTGAVWDDSNFLPINGGWSAHPNDGASVPNNSSTSMTYGPFSLLGASNGRVQFNYAVELRGQLRLPPLGGQLHRPGRPVARSGGVGLPVAAVGGHRNAAMPWPVGRLGPLELHQRRDRDEQRRLGGQRQDPEVLVT